MDAWPILTVLFFFVIFSIQFALFYLLYKAVKKTILKLTDVENVMVDTAEKVMALKEKTPVATYKEVIVRLKEGQDLQNISEDFKIELVELQALNRVLEAVKNR